MNDGSPIQIENPPFYLVKQLFLENNMKNITKITLSLICLIAFALLWLVGATPAKADADLVASITFDPPLSNPNSMAVGDTFVATINLSSATSQEVSAIGMFMFFDHTKVQVNSVTPLNGFTFCLPLLSFDNASGTISGDCANFANPAVTNLDVLEIEFEVFQTDTYFDLTFDQVCDGATSSDCFQAIFGVDNQIAVYNDSTNTPLSVTLQTMGITNETAVLPSFGIVLVALVLITAVVILFYKRQQAKLY